MIQKSRAIVLHQLKYSETSVIATLYTETFGRQSYLINGIRSSKSKHKTGMLQALFLLEIDAYHKQGRDLQRMKEIRMCHVFQTIPFDISKSSMAMFLAELLNKVLHSEERDTNLFNFIYDSIHYFDSITKGASNFHLWFLVQLLGYLGFRLHNNYMLPQSWFDMKTGSFVQYRPTYPKTPDLEESKNIAELINLNADDFHLFSISGNQRARLLEILIEYYTLHIDGMGNIYSLKVLQEIFH